MRFSLAKLGVAGILSILLIQVGGVVALIGLIALVIFDKSATCLLVGLGIAAVFGVILLLSIRSGMRRTGELVKDLDEQLDHAREVTSEIVD